MSIRAAFWVASLPHQGEVEEGEQFHLRLSTETLTSVDSVPVAVAVAVAESQSHVAQLRLC